MLRTKHLATFAYSSLFLFLFFWFFGIDLSSLHFSHSDLAVSPGSPLVQPVPVITVEAQNLSSVTNLEVSGDLESFLPGSITAILPVLPETVDQIPDLLKPFLSPPDVSQFPRKYNQSGITHLIVLSPESSLAFVRRELQAAFIFVRPALELDLDISLHPWSLQIPIDESDEISLDTDVALLRAVSQLGLEDATILLMDPTGLSSLSSLSVLSFLSPVRSFLLGPNTQMGLPFGPYGVKAVSYLPISSTSEWGLSLDLQPAKYLYPPFIVSSSIVVSFCDHLLLLETEDQAGDANGVNANVWPLFGSFVSSFRNDSIGGLKIQPATSTDPQELSPPSSESASDVFNLSFFSSSTSTPVDFLFVLPSLADLHRASSLICLLLSNSTRPNLVIIIHTGPSFDVEIEPDDMIWESPVLEIGQSCRIAYENVTFSSYFAFPTWFLQRFLLSDSLLPIHLLFTVREFTPFLPLIVAQNPNIFNSTTHISIPRTDLAYTDWIASLSIAELRNWHIPHVSLSITTRNRPRSLRRLLNSLSSALYFGDLSPSFSVDPDSFDNGGNQATSLRINIEQDCDQETLRIVKFFEWPPSRLEDPNRESTSETRKRSSKSNLYIHHRIVHGGLLPAVVESWFPKDPLHDYGLLLEDDVEVSPLFYAWVKMCLLKYRYGDESNKSPHMFGLSLYQQKHLELPIQGRRPFNPRSLFSSQIPSAENSNVDPITPYLSQIPCSWGALYFPEHWEQFHSFLAYRLSERSIIPLSTPIVPSVRSNLWLSSWKRFFIELVYLRGYVMLYPNFEGFVSLSTNHLEPGAHVKSPPAFNSTNFANPNQLNSSYLDLEKEKEKRDLFRLPLMQLPFASRPATEGPMNGTGLLQLPANRLPSLENLPILNLTGFLSSQKTLQDQGDRRRRELFNCDGNFSRSGAELYSVLELFCVTAVST